MEHLHLAHVVAVSWALVGAELEDALGFGGRDGRRGELRPAFKGREQRILHALKGGRSGGRTPEGVGGFQKFVVVRQLQVDFGERGDDPRPGIST